MSNRRVDVEIKLEHQEYFNLALAALEGILDATVWAIVATDDQGTFVFPRPDNERAVIDYLASVNWRTARLLAQEHCP